MPALPLGTQAARRGVLPEAVLRNMYVERDESGLSPDQTLRIKRPGLTRVSTLPSALRGLHYRTSTGERLGVAGTTLYSGTTSKGSLGTGIGPVAMASTPFLSLIVSGTSLYRYDTAVAQVSLPNDAPRAGAVQDVDQLNGYVIVLQPNGRFYWIVPGETPIQALNYATAESLPDNAVAVRRLGDEFWIFGTENVEVWQPTGDLNLPFQRASGRNLERGCLYRDAVRRFDNTLVWIGDDHQVYRAANVPEVISTNAIAEQIGRAYGDCSAWTFGIDGHAFYVLNVPGQGTFAYDASTKLWSAFTTLDEMMWRPVVGYQENGTPICGSSVDGAVYRLDGTRGDDDGLAIECVVTGSVPLNGKPPRNDSISVGVAVDQDATIRLRWRDGRDDYPAVYEEMDVRAPFDVAQVWRLGMPDQPYREFEVSQVGKERLTFAGAMVNEGWI